MNRFRHLIGVCLIISGFHTAANAADQPWFKVIAGDFAYTVAAPVRFADHPLHVGAAAAIGTLMICGLDSRLDDHYAGRNSGEGFFVPRAMNRIGEYYDEIGSPIFVLSSAGALAAGGVLTKRPDLVKTAGLGVEAVIFTKIYTTFLKRTFSRSRPFLDRGPRDFDFLNYRSPDRQRSMPSGHTSSIFAFVTVLTERHPSWWVRIPAFTLGVCVAIQRMDSRNHWLSDTFFGAALGYGIGQSVAGRHQTSRHSDAGLQSFLFPGGLGIRYQF